jgi:uncharacterized membrane protein HdeD (DUF308 family)
MAQESRAMKRIYLVLGGIILAIGLLHMLATLRYTHPKSAIWFFGTGIALVLAGVLNLLNHSYGRIAPGLWRVCMASNVFMLAFAAFAGVKSGASAGEFVFMLGTLGGATALSLTSRSLREPSAASGGKPRP